jgi:hypothetical protein
MFDSQKDINIILMCIKISEKENLSHPAYKCFQNYFYMMEVDKKI